MKDKKFESAIKNVAQEMALLKQENDLLLEQLRISEHRNKILHKYINSQFDKHQEKEEKNDRYN